MQLRPRKRVQVTVPGSGVCYTMPDEDPLKGVKAWMVEPPEDWKPHQRAALYHGQYGRKERNSQQLARDLGNAHASLKQLLDADKSLISLTPVRWVCAWRLVRAHLLRQDLIRLDEGLGALTPVEIQPFLPPAPGEMQDMWEYDPEADEALMEWLRGQQDAALEMGLLTTYNEDLTGQQTLGLLSPHFARACWPLLTDLLVIEQVLVKSISQKLAEEGPLGTRLYLIEAYGMTVAEAVSTISFVQKELLNVYDLDDPAKGKATMLARIDEIFKLAKADGSPAQMVNAARLQAQVAGYGRAEGGADDLTDPLTRAHATEVLPDNEDPLALDMGSVDDATFTTSSDPQKYRDATESADPAEPAE